MPPGVEWLNADFWIPIAAPARTPPGSPRAATFAFHGRLRPGVTVEAAEAQLTALVKRRVTLFPDEYRQVKTTNFYAEVQTLVDRTVRDFRGVLYTLFAAVTLLLFIACCNVANMLLARASAREREMAVRAALGAGRWRIVRQLLIESLVLGLGGVAAGVLLASLGVGLVQEWLAVLAVPAEATLRLDVPVLLAALSAGLLATLAFGLYPALHGARRNLITGSTGATRSSTPSRRQQFLRNGLVVAEVALSLVLVLGAGLLLRSFLHRIDFDLGYHRKVFVAQFGLPPGPPPAPAVLQQFYRDVLDRVGRIPGVHGTAMSATLPPFGASTVEHARASSACAGRSPRADLQFLCRVRCPPSIRSAMNTAAIRLALGGERRHVAGQVLRMTLWLVGTGVVIGLGAGLATGRLVASQFYRHRRAIPSRSPRPSSSSSSLPRSPVSSPPAARCASSRPWRCGTRNDGRRPSLPLPIGALVGRQRAGRRRGTQRPRAQSADNISTKSRFMDSISRHRGGLRPRAAC